MNKERFLKELEKKLKVLSPEEKQDILNEYEDIIIEKMKHGKTEEEAVKELGDIASLSEEILKSYKINPNYQKNGSDILGDCEDLIKQGAKKLSEVTEEVVDSIKRKENDMHLESIFEIVIKVLLILVFLSLLRIPFWIVGEIGQSLFGNLFFGGHFLFSNHNWFGILIKVVIELTYIGICVLLIVTILKKSTSSKQFVETEKKTETLKNTKIKEEESKIQVKSEVKQTSNRTNVMSEVIVLLIKLLIGFLFIFPLFMIVVGLLIALCILIYLLIKGIGVYAPLVLVIGVFLFITHLLTILIRLLFTNKKITLWPFGFSFILIVLGGIFTIDYVWSFTYSSERINTNYALKVEEYTYKIEDVMRINYDEIEIDNSLEDDEIKVEVAYYNEFVSLNKHEYTYQEGKNSHHDIEDREVYAVKSVYFYTEKLNTYSINTILNETIIKDLKNRQIHNYERIFSEYVKVYVNENTRRKVY